MAIACREQHIFLGKQIQEPRDFSEATAQIIAEEVQHDAGLDTVDSRENRRDYQPAVEPKPLRVGTET